MHNESVEELIARCKGESPRDPLPLKQGRPSAQSGRSPLKVGRWGTSCRTI